jgi:hypothetical protein
MDAEELDVTIIEATGDYRPVAHANGTPKVESPGPETPPEPGPVAPPAGDAERSVLESRIAALEADVESWQRRTIMWRERALSVQALNEALNTNLDDLRTALRALAPATPSAPEVEGTAMPASQHPVRPLASATVVEWCNKVFRRDFWTGPR